jgi:hypothetical protein
MATALLALAAVIGSPSPPRGDAQTGKKKEVQTGKQKKGGGTSAPATCLEVSGILLEHSKDGKSWRTLHAKDPVPAGATVIALPEAELRSKNGAIGLKMLADVGHRLELPVYEAGVIFHDNPKADLDFTLQRGVVTLTNLRKEGKAIARVRFRDQAWLLTLQEPGTKVALEMYGRYPPGLPVPVKKGAEVVKFQNEPTNDLLLMVVQGKAFVDCGVHGVPLQAPPGKAFVHWDNLGLLEAKTLDKLPEDLVKPLTADEKKMLQTINGHVKLLDQKSVRQGLGKLLASDDARGRRIGVVVAGAMDDLPRLTAALTDRKNDEVRDQAVKVLRNWLGRGPGQAERLFAELTGPGKYTRIDAGTVLFLLFGPDEKQLALPAFYDVLIAMLNHDKVAIRELAHWHLQRLVPSGSKIGYDPAAPAEAREKAQAQWRKLIPPGKVPPETKAPDKR